MNTEKRKSSTDLHWDNRSKILTDDSKVNIGDTIQRRIETDFIMACLPTSGKLLEVGCGNGHLTKDLRSVVDWVDAFDYSDGMIDRAKRYVGERNNRFFSDDIVSPKSLDEIYDIVVCVRVLINLRNLDEQLTAIENIQKTLRKGGKLIIIEGFRDGFDALSSLRVSVGLPEIQPAAINFYSAIADVTPTLTKFFDIERTFDSGTYDFLTRVVYPLLVGPDNVDEAGEFHQKTLPLAKAFRAEGLASLARLHGYCLAKR